MKTCVERWKANNNDALPECIIVFRDGLSDVCCLSALVTPHTNDVWQSQYRLLIEKELPQMKEAFASFPGYHPTLSVVVCEKRHHTRFYGTSEDQVTNNGNTPPGTVVDKGVTDVYNHDFYLQVIPRSIQLSVHLSDPSFIGSSRNTGNCPAYSLRGCIRRERARRRHDPE